jgi:hypothetical protein
MMRKIIFLNQHTMLNDILDKSELAERFHVINGRDTH